MKRFIYCESQEGGMDAFPVRPPKFEEFSQIHGWMNGRCKEDDEELLAWAKSAEIGDYYSHRLGMCFCMKAKP